MGSRSHNGPRSEFELSCSDPHSLSSDELELALASMSSRSCRDKDGPLEGAFLLLAMLGSSFPSLIALTIVLVLFVPWRFWPYLYPIASSPVLLHPRETELWQDPLTQALCHCPSCVETEAPSDLIVCNFPRLRSLIGVFSLRDGKPFILEVPALLPALLCQLHNCLEVAGVVNVVFMHLLP